MSEERPGAPGTSSRRRRLQGQADRRERPTHRLSYQTHEHRSEHWVVVAGQRHLRHRGRDRRRPVRASPSTSASHHAHRIANEHDDELVIIEVQRGPYLGEDDIVRLQDDYGRDALQAAHALSSPRPRSGP